MDPIEKAIRNAFEKGDPRDPAFREKVYRSAASALDRALKANPATTVERAISRRKTLESTVAAIETEFRRPPAPAAETEWNMSVEGERRVPGSPAPPIAVETRGSQASPSRAARIEPSLDGGRTGEVWEEDADERSVAVDPDMRRQTGRSPLARLAGPLLLLVFLGLVGASGWWLNRSGLLPLAELFGSDAAQTADGQDAVTGEEESVAGPLSENQETRAWINIFNPQDPSTVGVPAGANATVETSEGLKLLRIRSGEAGEPIRFEVGQGVLEQLAGKSATFDIVARAETADGGNFSVACDFGTFGECRRRRYAATAATRADFLFEVEFPSGRPKAGGTILIDPDVTGSGKAVDVFEIRVALSE